MAALAQRAFITDVRCYQMNKRPRYPAFCLMVSGGLSLFLLLLLSTANGNQHSLLRPAAAVAFVLLIIVMMKGDSWQKVLAGSLLFVPSFGLLASVMD